jgi:uncharacterized protein YndB with AHSA1/START domain
MQQTTKGVLKMIKVQKSIVIRRPIEEVFAFVGDQRNAPQWQHGLLEVRRTTEGPLGIGTRHTFVRKFMGRKMEASNEYVEYEPNKKVTFTSTSGAMDLEASYLTESTVEGTKLTSMIEMQPRGFAGLAEPLIAASLRREMEASLGELKDLLESGVVGVTAS